MTVEGIPAMLRRAGDILAPLLAGDGEQLELTDLLQATGWHVDALTGLDLDALAASLKQVSAQLGPLLHDPPDDLLEGGLALGQMAAPLGAVVDAIARGNSRARPACPKTSAGPRWPTSDTP